MLGHFPTPECLALLFMVDQVRRTIKMGRAGNCSVLLGAGGYVGVGDGFQGLAVASGADGVVEVFRGFGDGTFAAAFVRNPTPGSPSPCGKSPLLSAPSIPKVMDSAIPLTAVV